MKNSPADIVSKSQRVRANAVWLMNAASLAIAIGAVSQVSKSPEGNLVSNLVPTVQAADYYWTGSASLGATGTTSATAIGGSTLNMWSTQAGGGAAFTDAILATNAFSLATDNIYFNGATSGWVNHGSNRAANSINFGVGAGAYTFAPNSNASNRKIEMTSGGKIENNSTIAAGQTFNEVVWIAATNTGINSVTVSAAANAKMTFNGTQPLSSIYSPYGSGTSAYAAFALITNSTSKFGILNIAGAGTIVVNGAINDGGRQMTTSTIAYNSATAGGLTITSSGNTYLAGANSYTGGTTISNGMVYVQNAYAFGGNRAVDTTATSNTLGAGYNGASSTAYFAGPGSSLATGFSNTTQAFKNVILNSGTIDLSGTTMVGANALTINGTGASGASGALQNSSVTGATYAGAVTLGSASTINAGTGNLTLSGGLNTATNAATLSGARNTSVTGVLSGTGSINKTGAGTLTLSGNNTYTGSINIEQGVVSLVAATGSALGTGTGALSFGASNTPTLTLGGRSATMGNLSSSNANAVIQNDNATAATFTSSAPGTTTFAGKLSDGATGGKLSFVKAGSGTLTLSNAQDYTGTTTIAGGTLSLTGSTKVGSAVTVSSGATLSGSGTVNDSLTVSGSISPGAVGLGNLTAGATNLQSGGTLNVQIYDFTGAAGSTGWDLLTSTGAITVNSTSDLTLNKFNIVLSSITGSGVDTTGSALNFTNSSNYSLKILTGTSISGFDASKFNITGSISNVNTGVWSIGLSDNDINLIYTAANAQFWNGLSGWDGSATVGGTGTWDSTGYSSSLDTFFAGTGAAVSVDTVTTSKAIKFQSDSYVLSGGTITLTGADSSTNKIDVGTGLTTTINSKIVSATSTLNKTGLGILVLGGANGTSGITSGLSIANGTIKIASADALGSSGSAVTVASGATLDLNGQSVTNTNSLTLSGTGAASAGGALVNTSSNAATYAGLASLGAATTINASSGSISLTNGGTITGSGFGLTVTGSNNTSIASIIGTGAGTLTKTGNGTLTLSNANTYTGATTVSAGILQLANAGALGSSGATYSATTIASGATLDLNGQNVSNTNTLTLSGTGAASAGGALINSSVSASTFAGLATLGAATTINASSGSISLTNGGTITGSGFGLTVTGSNNTSIASIIGTGAGTLTKEGTGTLTLSGANTYTGATTISAGTITLGAAGALTAGTVTVSGSGATGGSLNLNGLTVTAAPDLILNGGNSTDGALRNSSASTAKFDGAIQLQANSLISSSQAGGHIFLSGVISGSDYALSVASGGTDRAVKFIGTSANTFGSLSLGNGDLFFTSADQLSTGTITTTSSGARLVLRAGNSTTQTNASDAAVIISNVIATGSEGNVLAFTPGPTVGTTNNSIELTGKISGSGGIKISGSAANLAANDGILIINNSANDYTGTTEAGNGILRVANDASLGNGGSVLFTTADHSTLEYTDNNSDVTRNFVIGSTSNSNSTKTGRISVASGKAVTIAGVISNLHNTDAIGALAKTGTGTLNLSAVNTYTGATSVSNGILNLGSTGSILTSSAVTVSNTATLKATNSYTGSTIGSATAIAGAITLNSGAIIDLTAGSLKATSLTVGILNPSEVTKISYTIGTSFALTGGLTLTGNLVLDLTGTLSSEGTYDVLTYAGEKSGAGTISLFSRAGGTWGNYSVTGALNTTDKKYTITVSTFTDGGSYAAGVTVPNTGDRTIAELSGGTANISASNTVISALSGTGAIALTSGAKVKVESGTSSGVISGTGALVKQGADTLILTAANTYSDKTEITKGTLKVSSKNASTGIIDGLGSHTDLALGSGSNDSKLSIAATGAATLDKNIIASSTDRTGTGNILENSGTGLLTVTGSLTKNGTVLTLTGGTYGMEVTGEIIGSSAIANSSDVFVTGGTTTVSYANNYDGPTKIQATGTLVAANASATGTGIVTVETGGTLQVGTSTNHALTLTTGGFALTNGSIIRVYIGSLSTSTISTTHTDATGATVYDQSSFAGTNYSSLTTTGLLDTSLLTTEGGGVTIELYSTAGDNAAVTGLNKTALYDLKFLTFGSISDNATTLNISRLFTIDYSHIRDASGNALFADSRIATYLQMNNTGTGGSIMMTIPEPSTYGLGLGALALAAVAIRRRKQKKSVA